MNHSQIAICNEVYTPTDALPWDDAVTLALKYAGIDYTPIYDIDPGLIATGLLAPWNGDPDGSMKWNPSNRDPSTFPDGASTTILLGFAAIAEAPRIAVRWPWMAALGVVMLGVLVSAGVTLWRTTRFA